MMKQVTITVDGQEWPCRPTMGAMLRFKRETGHEITEIEGNNLTDICTYLWCCVKSASSADGKPFELSLLEFADRIDKNDLVNWASLIGGDDSAPADGKGKKKAPSRS